MAMRKGTPDSELRKSRKETERNKQYQRLLRSITRKYGNAYPGA
jgi:hypothetical protein